MQQLQMRNASEAIKAKANRKSMTVKEMRVKRQSTIDQIAVKRNFYGVDETQAFFIWLYKEHGRMIQNAAIIFFYYLLGGWFYSSCSDSTDPKMLMRPAYIGTPGNSNSIAMNNFYYITVTVTSVGYGDIFPVGDTARVFTIVYIFLGIGVIGRCLNEFAQVIIDFAETKAAERRNKTQSVDEMNFRQSMGWNHVGKVFNAVGSAFLTLMCGTVFFMNNEQMDFIKALYFMVVTSSTVGYGDITPSVDSSRLFLIFYITTSCIIVAVSIGNIAQVFMEMKDEARRLEMMKRKLDFQMIRDIDKNGSGIDKVTFLTCMLVELGLVNEQKDVVPWLKKFEELDASGDGKLNVEDCIEQLERGEEERVNHLMQMLEQAEEADKLKDFLGNAMSLLHIETHQSNERAQAAGEAGTELTGMSKARSPTTIEPVNNPMKAPGGANRV